MQKEMWLFGYYSHCHYLTFPPLNVLKEQFTQMWKSCIVSTDMPLESLVKFVDLKTFLVLTSKHLEAGDLFFFFLFLFFIYLF